MRLKCVVLDGFKSYAHRQEIGDLDPHFNAITGLNGSGKSNIFDALCFVMGISSLKRVRAEEPRDLIYKSGNAGIQKAQVTIEFTNDDELTAPPGYPPSEFPTIRIGRQVQVGGKQKFFLNDRVSDQTKIKNFFRNALLNVDNAHFMVLQGTVHKMISMKSVEILGLLEEASGTRIFDTRRRTAENLLRSKEKRVEAINSAIDELSPRIIAMKSQQEEYNNFVRARDTLAEKSKFPLAYDYFTLTKAVEAKANQIASCMAAIDFAKGQLHDIPAAKVETSRGIESLKIKGQEPLDQLERLRDEEGECRKQMSKYRSLMDNADRSLKALERDLKKAESEYAASQAKAIKCGPEIRKAMDEQKQHVEDLAQARSNVEKLKASLRLQKSGVTAGINGVSLNEEKETLKNDILRLNGAARRDNETLKKQQHEADRLKAVCLSEEGSLSEAEARLNKQRSIFAAAEKRYLPLKETQERVTCLKQLLLESHGKIQQLTRDSYASSLIQPVRYEPVPGYDFDKEMYGYAGDLLLVKENRFSKALSVGAAAHLRKVVISTDAMAQVMIEKAIKSRTSFLPLNSITAHPIDANRMANAKSIASENGGFVELASTLVSFDSKFSVVADFVFGTFVVCSDLKLAQLLSTDARTRLRAVSVDGDLSDPSGLVTGGSNAGIRDVMADFKQMRQARLPLDNARRDQSANHAELVAAEKRLGAASSIISEYVEAEKAFLSAEHTLSGLKEGSPKALLGSLLVNIQQTKDRIAAHQQNIADLETRQKEVESHLCDDPEVAQRKIESQLQAESKRVVALEREAERVDMAHVRVTNLQAELELTTIDKQSDINRITDELSEKRGEREQHVASHQLHQNETDIISARLKEQEAKSAQLDQEMQELQAELHRLHQQEELLSKTVKDGETQIRIVSKELQTDKSKLTQTKRDHPWIEDVESQLGDSNGPFYFDDVQRTKDTLEEISALRGIIAQSERSVNEKASMLYDAYRKDLDLLEAQRGTLSTDKHIILSTIEAVEKRKWGALDKMFKEVTNLFGSLFAACLPNASARLVEERDPESQRLTGLQVRVAFNGKEKESLTELSGGQRSLLALCLILAILRVRPAPVYILDEVDAALDPSHTQNIGHMLQTHFPTSQFLLVSLKDGMYNNANVLYEIRNTQGYSEVTRRAK